MASSTQDEEVRHRNDETALNEEVLDHDGADLNKEAKTNDRGDDKIVASEVKDANQDEEVHHRKEVIALDEADLNKEAKTDDETKHEDDDKTVASEVKDANQEVKGTNQEVMMVVPSTPRSLAKQEAKLKEDSARSAHIRVCISQHVVRPKIETYDHFDDSEQTLRFLTRWRAPELPPDKIIHHGLVKQCSRPIQKQMTTRDVALTKGTRVSLPRKKFEHLLDDMEEEEARVSVYGPDGKVHEMWLDDDDDEKGSFDLTVGWWTFVGEYGLKECCDFLTFWMFKHGDTQRVCLAVDVIRFAFRKHVSKRISDAAFEDSD